MHEVPPVPQVESRIDVLMGRLRNSRLKKDRDTAITEIVSATCEHSFDYTAVFQTINLVVMMQDEAVKDEVTWSKGLAGPAETIDNVRKILRGMDTYFKRNKNTIKQIFPGVESYDQEYTYFSKNLRLASTNMESTNYDHEYPGLRSVIKTAEISQRDLAKISHQFNQIDERPPALEVFYDGDTLRDMHYRMRNAKVDALLHELYFKAAPKEESAAPKTVPEKIISALSEIHETPVDGAVDYLTGKYGKHSLAEILSQPNTRVAVDHLLTFIADMPKGDIVWNDIVGGIFLYFPDMSLLKTFENPENSDLSVVEKIFAMQLQMADRFFMPFIDASSTDRQFDKAFSRMLGCMTDGNIHRLRMAMWDGGEIGMVSVHQSLQPHMNADSWDAIPSSMQHMAKAALDFPSSYRMQMIPYYKYKYLYENWEKIEQSTINRLGDTEGVRRLVKELRKLQLTDFRDQIGRISYSYYLEDGGVNAEEAMFLCEVYEQQTSKHEESTVTEIAGGFYVDTDEQTNEITCTKYFSEGSLAARAGLSGIRINPLQVGEQETCFRLITAKQSEEIIGLIIPEPETGILRVRFPLVGSFGNAQAYGKLFTYVALEAYQSLLKLGGPLGKEPLTADVIARNITMQRDFATSEDIERVALQIYRKHGTISEKILQSENQLPLLKAIKGNYEHIGILKERLAETVNRSAQTPREVSEMVDALLKKLE